MSVFATPSKAQKLQKIQFQLLSVLLRLFQGFSFSSITLKWCAFVCCHFKSLLSLNVFFCDTKRCQVKHQEAQKIVSFFFLSFFYSFFSHLTLFMTVLRYRLALYFHGNASQPAWFCSPEHIWQRLEAFWLTQSCKDCCCSISYIAQGSPYSKDLFNPNTNRAEIENPSLKKQAGLIRLNFYMTFREGELSCFHSTILNLNKRIGVM